MPAKKYHHGDLPSALVNAARSLLVRYGIQSLTLRACAREAGVSHAAPLHHFANLDELLCAIAASGFEDFYKALAHDANPADNPVDRLVAMGHAYCRFAQQNPALYRVMFGVEKPHTKTEPLRRAMGAAWQQLYDAVVAVGGDKNANDNAILVWSNVHGQAMLRAAECTPGHLNLDEIEAYTIKTIVLAIKDQ